LHTTIALPAVLVVVATFAHAIVLGAIRHASPDMTVVMVQAVMHAVLVPVVYIFFNAIDHGALQEAGR
jgi:cation transport ATPase